MTPPACTAPLAILAAAILLAGCGAITDPYHTTSPRPAPATSSTTTSPSSTTATTPADAGDPAAERGGTIPPGAQAAQNQLSAAASATTPQAALTLYTELYSNWTAANIIARQRALASISLSQARAQALHAAASAARDPQLTTSHVANHGQLIAIASGEGTAAGDWVIVTRETTTGHGDYARLPTQLHITYATVTHTPHGWTVSRWSPQL